MFLLTCSSLRCIRQMLYHPFTLGYDLLMWSSGNWGASIHPVTTAATLGFLENSRRFRIWDYKLIEKSPYAEYINAYNNDSYIVFRQWMFAVTLSTSKYSYNKLVIFIFILYYYKFKLINDNSSKKWHQKLPYTYLLKRARLGCVLEKSDSYVIVFSNSSPSQPLNWYTWFRC